MKLRPEQIELIVLCVLAALGTVLFVAIDAFELALEFIESHEDWELDEAILALTVFGLAGFIYGSRRLRQLSRALRDKEKAEREARWLADHDALTGLPNRRFLSGWFKQFTAGRRKLGASQPPDLAVLSIDLNGFKKINDLHGHLTGDQILKAIALRLRKIFPNDFVARMGGDEFLAVIEAPSVDDLPGVQMRVVEEISRPITLPQMNAQVGASVGCALFPKDGRNFRDVIKNADLAMYEAKRNPLENCFVPFHPNLRTEYEYKTTIERELRQAIEKRDIVPFYQPIVDLYSSALSGFELLSRWQRPQGNVPPNEFIPIAEEKRLIDDLTELVLDQALAWARVWPRDLTLSFNLSPSQLLSDMMLSRIMYILDKHDFPPERLIVEITESAFIRDLASAQKVVGQFHATGMKIALDDFGTGYSSLSMIHELPIDRLKIDQRFVRNLNSSKKQVPILKAIIEMANELGIEVTAEGIEDLAQMDKLRQFHCPLGQGMYFGMPVPANEADQFIHRRQAVSISR